MFTKLFHRNIRLNVYKTFLTKISFLSNFFRRLLPWWTEWTYCQGLKLLSDSLSNKYSSWWRVYHLGKKKFKTKFLKYLACPEDSHFIKDYLNLINSNSTTSIMFFKNLSDQDYVNYFLFTIARHAKNPDVLDFILHNLENIKPK